MSVIHFNPRNDVECKSHLQRADPGSFEDEVPRLTGRQQSKQVGIKQACTCASPVTVTFKQSEADKGKNTK